MKNKITSILLIAALLLFTACGSSADSTKNMAKTDEPVTQADSGADDAFDHAPTNPEKITDFTPGQKVADPSGAEITIPEKTDSIVVLAPALSEIVTALGMGDKVTGYDIYSAGIEGLSKDAPTFDTTNPDMEQLAALAPDMLLTSNLTLYDRESPFQSLIDAGTCVICVPNSDSIAGIQSDIAFVAAVLGASEKGNALLDDFQTQLDALAAIAATIPSEEQKRVYFEIAPAPNMYSFGSGVYLNEMIAWIFGENIFADQKGWISVEGESVVAADPDVIFTNADYMDDPVQEILSRDGWADISAVKKKQVCLIDKNYSSRPNHNIVKAMRQMAEFLYPDYYKAK